MNRLTMTSEKGGVAFTFDLDITCKPSEAQKILKLANKLKHYEDLEEQGLLLRLPVAEGTNVFCIGSCGEICDDYETDCEVCGEHKVVFCMNFDRNMVEQFGKTVFLIKEEAEQALKQIGE